MFVLADDRWERSMRVPGIRRDEGSDRHGANAGVRYRHRRPICRADAGGRSPCPAGRWRTARRIPLHAWLTARLARCVALLAPAANVQAHGASAGNRRSSLDLDVAAAACEGLCVQHPGERARHGDRNRLSGVLLGLGQIVEEPPVAQGRLVRSRNSSATRPGWCCCSS